MSDHLLMEVTSARIAQLRNERWALAQARWSRRPYLARTLATGLRRLAAALDGEPVPRYAAAR